MPLTDRAIRGLKPGPKPRKVADGAGLFLTSELASYVTGQVISVGGGVGAKFTFPMDGL